jgi:hypothetical protein
MDTLKLNGVFAAQPVVAVKTKFEKVTPSTEQLPTPVNVESSAAMVPAAESHKVSPNAASEQNADRASMLHTLFINLPPSNLRNTTQGVLSARVLSPGT